MVKRNAPANHASTSTISNKKPHGSADSIDDHIQHRASLLSMSNDCIFEVLTYLQLKDLSSVANACSRLQTLAQMTFSSEYRGRVVRLEESEETVEDCLRNFGSQIQSIYLERPSDIAPRETDGNAIVSLVVTYCRSLTHLEVRNYNFVHETL